MAYIMRPRPAGDCHDYACGSAGLLRSYNWSPASSTLQAAAQAHRPELQAESYAVAQMNGIIHDMEIETARGDTMINPPCTADGKGGTARHRCRQSDVNQPTNPDIFKDDPFDCFRTAAELHRQGEIGPGSSTR